MPALIIRPTPPPSSSSSSSSPLSTADPSTPPPPPSPRSDPATIAHVRHRLERPPSRATAVRNRRLAYLHAHPEYFTAPDLELADPLLYDRLIRRFLTTAEREEQGRVRGWSGVLEADIMRSEAKLAAIADSDADTEARAEKENGEQVETREEGEEMWKRAMTLRFLEGGDKDVDYSLIDDCEDLDLEEGRRDEEEKWFDAETPRWGDDGEEVCTDTGVQDY